MVDVDAEAKRRSFHRLVLAQTDTSIIALLLRQRAFINGI
jgi:hypothetical protein